MSNTAVFGYLNPILIGIVGANFQGSTQPLLATHSINICSFLLATLFYCIAQIAEAQLDQGNNYTHFWRFIAFVFGSVSSVSLVSTFVSLAAGKIILWVAWICAAIIIVVYQYDRLFMDGCRWFYCEILKPLFKNIWNRMKGNNMLTETEQPRPPV